MKKILYFTMIMAAGAFLASCQPTLIDGPDAYANVSESDLASGLSFKQYALNADGTYTEAADGNYIKYNSTKGVVQFYTIKLDADGNSVENIIATGASGIFPLIPKRGQDPNQMLYGRLANADGSLTHWQGSFNVYVPADLDPEIKMLVSDTGTKVWKWAYSDAPVWGNAGNSGAGAAFVPGVVDGQWWGAAPAELLDQLSHAAGGVATGAEDPDAYMVLDEDGNITSFAADGSVISKSTWTINDYDPSRPSGWELATLETKDPAVLFPFSINEGGKNVTKFDVMCLEPNWLTLVYTKGNGAGSWGEITFWKFKNASDTEAALNNYSNRKWGWAFEDAPVWGNAGNTGAGDAFKPTVVDGMWWGATPAELAGQMGHSDTGTPTGEEDFGAYMVFDNDGQVKTFDAAGNQIRGGAYSIAMNPDGRVDGWALGTLTTDPGSILFPFSINEGGAKPTEFDVMYIDGYDMTLVYTKGNGSGSWGEITFWLFKPKE